MINNFRITQLTAKIGSLALASSLISLGIAQSAQALSAGISSFSGNNQVGGGNTRGFRFRATEDLTVTALGVYDIDEDGIILESGRSGVDVGLWNDSETEPKLLGQVLVPGGMTAPELNGFRYAFLGTSIKLITGNFYRVGADLSDISGTDSIADAVPTNTISGIDINSIREARSDPDSAFSFPSLLDQSNQAFLGGNILVEDSVPVPFEVDATLGLLLVGGLFAGNKIYRRRKK